MKSILEELFCGNACPNTDCRSKDKETKELMGYVADHHDALMAELTDKQRETFEKFDDCYNELTDINERDFRLCLSARSPYSYRSTLHCIRFVR